MFPDISEFQGAVDWNALDGAYQTGEIEAVAIRAGFGTVRADHQFARNQHECRARGIPAIYYWFNYPAVNSPQAEASMFNTVVGPLQPSEAMVGDFEDDPPYNFPRGPAGASWAQAFLTQLQAPQNASWFYTYSSLFDAASLATLIGTWPFWWADYTAAPDSARPYAIARQFTNQGVTPGIGAGDQSRVLRPPLGQWLTPAPPVPSPRPPANQEEPMSVSFEPRTTDAYAAGFYQGRPGGFAPRTVYVAVASDQALNGPRGQVTLHVFFISKDFATNGQVEEQDATLTGSQQMTLSPTSLTGEMSVRIQHVSGGQYFARVYEEFLPFPT